MEGQLLLSKYRLGKKAEAKQMAITDLSNTDNKYSFLFSIYYDEVLTDLSLTSVQAKNAMLDLYNEEGIAEKIDAKIDALDFATESDEKLKIATLSTKIKIMKCKCNLMGFKYNPTSAEVKAYQDGIDDLEEVYQDLINN